MPDQSPAIELRALTDADIDAHNAGEDALTVKWLTGGYGTTETTKRHFDMLASHAAAGTGKQGWGVWLDGRLAGYVDADPTPQEGVLPGQVNISYNVHPWARGLGVAGAAVSLALGRIRELGLGHTAVIRMEPENLACVRVAEKAGFRRVGSTDTLLIYTRDVAG